MTDFVGRRRELKELREDIARTGLDTLSGRKAKAPRARVLLVAGRPGSGRTALAEAFVREVRSDYPDGVLRTRLTTPGGEAVATEQALRGLLEGLGEPTPPGAAEDELSSALRAALADRKAILLVDDAGDPFQVDALLPDTPECLVVVTSEGPLTGIPDVRPCTLGGLDPTSAVLMLSRRIGDTRITVDPRAAEGLAEECGGQPAALALAGGWLAVHPKASVADVAKQLHEMTPGISGPLGRAFRLVYESLPQPAQRTLRLLPLAPAGIVDSHTASALAGCSVAAAQSTLEDFAGLGLVRPGQDGLFLLPGCLTPLLRALLEAKERPAEVQLARARMLERTVRLLHSCRAMATDDEDPGVGGPEKLDGLPRALRFPDRRAAATWLDTRLPALSAAASLAVADGGLDTLARRLVAALVRALAEHRGTAAAAPELYGLHRLVLDVAERRDLYREQAAALLNLADLDAETGRTQEALERYRAALDAGRAANDPYATGRAMESVGGAYQELADWHRASDWFGRALSQALARGERADEARLYGRLGNVHTYAGRYGDALRSWRAAAAGYRRLADVPGQAKALSEMARVQEYAGRPEESLHTCREAVDLARRAGDLRLHAALEVRLADTLDRLGDPAAARLHRATADRLLGDDPAACEIRSDSD
ncbi:MULTISPECIES: tetratricopeptide repeat protein [unclassified Streptomyces]|uniref:tetratricopeptide repeat protein n=1 Tax=unclassified Streptomyces TaxID=2593676 RepID=UPI00225BFEF0|nr:MULTISPECIES: tetratricopeptide repeat protein [unclassified Streptomyces]MCX4525101.1 tetratricopeptide repeat protein [Streptomyces sp. NBC_01551]MCX4544388.1 tetratricopeptide repeat protein [Streptomyces sp. NBC_01565]